MRSDSCTNDNEKSRLQTEEEKDKRHLFMRHGILDLYFKRMLLEISSIFLSIFRFFFYFVFILYFMISR